MEADNDTKNPLGNWADGDFTPTVTRNLGVGANAGLPDENRFVSGVVQLLRQRRIELERLDKSEDSEIAIFVLKRLCLHLFPMLRREPMIDNGLVKVVGRLWLTAAPVISAHYIDLPMDSDERLFSFVTDELNLGRHPAMIFDPRPAEASLRWYPKGLQDPDTMELKPLDGVVSPEDVFAAIDRVYNHCLVTPASLPQGGRLWQHPNQYRPVSNAEALLQSLLKAALLMRFPFCTVRHEQTQPAGRTDLEIEESEPQNRSRVVRHAILELKVLRSHWAPGRDVTENQTKEHIKEGVRQAGVYRQEKGSEWSALCCFDMRRSDVGDDACFAHVREKAQDLQVRLRRWYLYAKADEYRRATAGLA